VHGARAWLSIATSRTAAIVHEPGREGVFDPVAFSAAAVATVGTTVSIPKDAWHEVTRIGGARLLMIFTPGRSDRYLAELAALRETDIQEEIVVKALSHKRDL